MSLRTRSLARASRLATGVMGGGAGVAAALGDLRGLAAKVGQMASYVEGMAPDDPRTAAAFARLRASAPSSDPAEVRALVEAELGREITAVFRTWEPEPFASASLGQVHRATLADGTPVAVKVQHPGIWDAVAADLRQAERIGAVVAPITRGIPVRDLVAEIRERIGDELDYRVEARSQERYRAAFADRPGLRIPAVFGDASAKRVLTTSLASGVGLEQLALEPADVRDRAASTLWALFVEGAFRTGLLHGDPHPGNFLFDADGGVTALDFGCVQPLDGTARASFRALLDAAAAGRVREHLAIWLGASPTTEALGALWELLLQPIRHPDTRLDREHARAVARATRASKRPGVAFAQQTPLPPWFVLSHRTFVGLINVIARIEGRVGGRPPQSPVSGGVSTPVVST